MGCRKAADLAKAHGDPLVRPPPAVILISIVWPKSHLRKSGSGIPTSLIYAKRPALLCIMMLL